MISLFTNAKPGAVMYFSIIFLIMALLIIYVIREVVCWYWKLNRIVELLERIDTKLSLITYQEDKAQVSSPELANDVENRGNTDKLRKRFKFKRY